MKTVRFLKKSKNSSIALRREVQIASAEEPFLEDLALVQHRRHSSRTKHRPTLVGVTLGVSLGGWVHRLGEGVAFERRAVRSNAPAGEAIGRT